MFLDLLSLFISDDILNLTRHDDFPTSDSYSCGISDCIIQKTDALQSSIAKNTDGILFAEYIVRGNLQ